MTIRAKNEGTHEFVISDATIDRYDTVIPIKAWNLDNYRKNPIVAYSHNTSGWSGPDSIIGIGDVRIEDDKLIGTVTYEPADLNPLAEKIRRKVEYGTLRSTSVGFTASKGHWGEERNGEDPDIYYFDDVDLLEFSIVNIPANPNAVKRDIDALINRFSHPGEAIPDTPHVEPNIKAPANPRGSSVSVVKTRSWLTLHQSKNR